MDNFGHMAFRTFAGTVLAGLLSSLTRRWALLSARVYSALASAGQIAADDLIWGERACRVTTVVVRAKSPYEPWYMP